MNLTPCVSKSLDMIAHDSCTCMGVGIEMERESCLSLTSPHTAHQPFYKIVSSESMLGDIHDMHIVSHDKLPGLWSGQHPCCAQSKGISTFPPWVLSAVQHDPSSCCEMRKCCEFSCPPFLTTPRATTPRTSIQTRVAGPGATWHETITFDVAQTSECQR